MTRRTGVCESDVELTIRLLMSAPTSNQPISLDPRLLFEKARYARRIRVEAKVTRIVTTGQIAACIVVLAVLGGFLLTTP